MQPDFAISKALDRRYDETILFVHHFGGSPKNMHRHVALVNELGFDAVTFQLLINDFIPKQVPITGELRVGARHIWAEQVENMLNHIPGRKIVYSFSMPSLGALRAIGRRRANDVTAWVCDGGPFLDLIKCVWNLLEHEVKVENKIVRSLASVYGYAMFGMGAERQVEKAAAALPRMFPVLSIRGEKDPLVPVSAIEEVFKHAPQIELVRAHLENGKHLDGLKNFPQEYRSFIEPFLRQHAHLLTKS